MKLDRNTNLGGQGKYALVNMREVVPLIEEADRGNHETIDPLTVKRLTAFNILVDAGIITLGNETPGDQFFVMKYKDKFTAPGLQGYAHAVAAEATAKHDQELKEYAEQMFAEASFASKIGHRIPD